jgi:transposase-like protein
MKKRAAEKNGKQEALSPTMTFALHQLALPMLVASDAMKRGMLAFVQQMGMLALQEMLAADAEMIAGPKGKHAPDRSHHHWGSATTTVAFGGRHESVEYPRVRARGKGGKEAKLPSLETLRKADPMSARVAEQVVLGVSTRGYARSLEPVDEESIETRGDSMSNVSRSLIDRTTEKLAELLNRRLEELDVIAMFIDGIEIGKRSVVIALGVLADGTKVPLGVWAGSTENGVLATALASRSSPRGFDCVRGARPIGASRAASSRRGRSCHLPNP